MVSENILKFWGTLMNEKQTKTIYDKGI